MFKEICCFLLLDLINGVVDISGILIDSVVIFSCNLGFILMDGSLIWICVFNGLWIGILVECLGM